MYIDASKQRQLDAARLVSPVQSKTAGSCIHFYFNTYGTNVGYLNVYARSNGLLGNALLSYNTNSGD